MKVSKSFVSGLLVGLSSTLLFFIVIMPVATKKWYRAKYDHQEQVILRQEEMIDSLQNNNRSGLLANLLNRIDEKLKDNPNRILDEQIITSIADISYALKPFLPVYPDDSSSIKVSPERGQLLLYLSGLKLDSISYSKIKDRSTFAGADLPEANLNGRDLSGMNLMGANLRGADLRGADLRETDLSFGHLWGADLSLAKMNGANLKRAELSWAKLNGAEMINVNLHEADLVSAQLRKVNLKGAYLQWADFSGAFLNESDLSNSDMFRATLKRAQLVETKFSGSILTYAILSESNLIESDMTGADLTNLIIADRQWIDHVEKWNIKGSKEIKSQYDLIEAFSYEGSKYQLVKKK